jgi:hypothetical protein
MKSHKRTQKAETQTVVIIFLAAQQNVLSSRNSLSQILFCRKRMAQFTRKDNGKDQFRKPFSGRS